MKTLLSAVCITALLITGCNKDDVNENTNTTDTDFAVQASGTNKFEIQTGELAVTRSTDPAIVSLGETLRLDHQEAQNQLLVIAASLNISLPDTLNNELSGIRAQLIDLNGRTFDSVYAHGQVLAHQKAILQCQAEISSGQNGQLKDYASAQLPKLQMHLQSAQTIAANY